MNRLLMAASIVLLSLAFPSLARAKASLAIEFLTEVTIQEHQPRPADFEITFIGLDGHRCPRWVGCAMDRIAQFSVRYERAIGPDSEVYSQELVAMLKDRARALGGDAVSILRHFQSSKTFEGSPDRIFRDTVDVLRLKEED
nr:hypothetical protein [Candidatus Krumholzibacteria bacterium]